MRPVIELVGRKSLEQLDEGGVFLFPPPDEELAVTKLSAKRLRCHKGLLLVFTGKGGGPRPLRLPHYRRARHVRGNVWPGSAKLVYNGGHRDVAVLPGGD